MIIIHLKIEDQGSYIKVVNQCRLKDFVNMSTSTVSTSSISSSTGSNSTLSEYTVLVTEPLL